MAVTRFNQLRAHMVGHKIKWKDIATLLGMSMNSAIIVCQKDEIKPDYHAKLLGCGFPLEVLPEPIMVNNFTITGAL